MGIKRSQNWAMPRSKNGCRVYREVATTPSESMFDGTRPRNRDSVYDDDDGDDDGDVDDDGNDADADEDAE